ncbi:hypothetical protein OG979_13850 [Actinomadura citrea]|uniref:hypothetical protein n=1 Tax=Actinomadura citrea TaxID=46158 RepID=UPI002E29A1BA|nr:hypothetical protein [Actinomadura citrea]
MKRNRLRKHVARMFRAAPTVLPPTPATTGAPSLARQRRYFTQEYKDEIVRMVLDGPSVRIEANLHADNVRKCPANGGDFVTVRNDAVYTHFDNGWIKTSADPWDIVTSCDWAT